MTSLCRNDLITAYKKSNSANPGLLLHKGLTEIETKQSDGQRDSEDAAKSSLKTDHILRICKCSITEQYRRAYYRWQRLTQDENRFIQCAMKLDDRLLIGLAAAGALETGCALSHGYGAPYIPGSSIKGAVRAWAQQHLNGHDDALEQLLGTYDSGSPGAVSGLVTFHDAWWIPEKTTSHDGEKPLEKDIVTTHHQEYYNGGKEPAADTDSPIPNALVSVRGSFLFVLEGRPADLKPSLTLLTRALSEHGIGAKTAAGYGYMRVDDDWKREHQMTEEQKLADDVAHLNEQEVRVMFSRDLKKTQSEIEQQGIDFNQYARTVKRVHSVLIEGWKDETKKTSKSRYKAYQFFNAIND